MGMSFSSVKCNSPMLWYAGVSPLTVIMQIGVLSYSSALRMFCKISLLARFCDPPESSCA